ncbi:hypothetical protein GAU_1798 [Gemmatimonas aurantiaca T-27]|uniref:Uncharacterized protein n=1 Tax=Gemmatimonas aurantiaca (strain DSM 14586 / JCM 11422 / NBRC 100505 / T-27) TaxID=379066 RepID=C1A415_GEMAT|nr:hypothetical protein GAU_1798 [Gemmatimonas aurantiaca T-27]
MAALRRRELWDKYFRSDTGTLDGDRMLTDMAALLAELEGLRARDAEYCELADLLTEAAKDLESEIDTRYGYPDVHPSQRNKYNRDSETVTRLQKAADRARGEGR